MICKPSFNYVSDNNSNLTYRSEIKYAVKKIQVRSTASGRKQQF